MALDNNILEQTIVFKVDDTELQKTSKFLNDQADTVHNMRVDYEGMTNFSKITNDYIASAEYVNREASNRVSRFTKRDMTPSEIANYERRTNSVLKEQNAINKMLLSGNGANTGIVQQTAMVNAMSSSLKTALDAVIPQIQNVIQTKTSNAYRGHDKISERSLRNIGDVLSMDQDIRNIVKGALKTDNLRREYRDYATDFLRNVAARSMPAYATAEYNTARFGPTATMRTGRKPIATAAYTRLPERYHKAFQNKSADYSPRITKKDELAILREEALAVLDKRLEKDPLLMQAAIQSGLVQRATNGSTTRSSHVSAADMKRLQQSMYSQMYKSASGFSPVHENKDIFGLTNDVAYRRLASGNTGTLVRSMGDLEFNEAAYETYTANALKKLEQNRVKLNEGRRLTKMFNMDRVNLFVKDGNGNPRVTRSTFNQSTMSNLLGLNEREAYSDVSDAVITLGLNGLDPDNKEQLGALRNIIKNGYEYNGRKYRLHSQVRDEEGIRYRMIEENLMKETNARYANLAKEHGLKGNVLSLYQDPTSFTTVAEVQKHYDALNKLYSPGYSNPARDSWVKVGIINTDKLADGLGWVAGGIQNNSAQTREMLASKGTNWVVTPENEDTLNSYLISSGLAKQDENGKYKAKIRGMGSRSFDAMDYGVLIDASKLKNQSIFKGKTTEEANRLATALYNTFGGEVFLADFDTENNQGQKIGTQAVSYMQITPAVMQAQMAGIASRIAELNTVTGIKKYVFANSERNNVAALLDEDDSWITSDEVQNQLNAYISSLIKSAASGEIIDYGNVEGSSITRGRLAQMLTYSQYRQNGISKEQYKAAREALRANMADQYGNMSDKELDEVINDTMMLREGNVISYENLSSDNLGLVRSPTGLGEMIYVRNRAKERQALNSVFGEDLAKVGLQVGGEDAKTMATADWDADQVKILTGIYADMVNVTKQWFDDISKGVSVRSVDVKDVAGDVSNEVENQIQRTVNLAREGIGMGSGSGLGMRAALFDLAKHPELVAEALRGRQIYDLYSTLAKSPKDIEIDNDDIKLLSVGREYSRFTSRINDFFNFDRIEDMDLKDDEGRIKKDHADVYYDEKTGQYVNMRALREAQLEKINLPSINNGAQMLARTVMGSIGMHDIRSDALENAMAKMVMDEEGLGDNTRRLLVSNYSLLNQFAQGRQFVTQDEEDAFKTLMMLSKGELRSQASKMDFSNMRNEKGELMGPEDWIKEQERKLGFVTFENFFNKFGITEKRAKAIYGDSFDQIKARQVGQYQVDELNAFMSQEVKASEMQKINDEADYYEAKQKNNKEYQARQKRILEQREAAEKMAKEEAERQKKLDELNAQYREQVAVREMAEQSGFDIDENAKATMKQNEEDLLAEIKKTESERPTVSVDAVNKNITDTIEGYERVATIRDVLQRGQEAIARLTAKTVKAKSPDMPKNILEIHKEAANVMHLISDYNELGEVIKDDATKTFIGNQKTQLGVELAKWVESFTKNKSSEIVEGLNDEAFYSEDTSRTAKKLLSINQRVREIDLLQKAYRRYVPGDTDSIFINRDKDEAKSIAEIVRKRTMSQYLDPYISRVEAAQQTVENQQNDEFIRSLKESKNTAVANDFYNLLTGRAYRQKELSSIQKVLEGAKEKQSNLKFDQEYLSSKDQIDLTEEDKIRQQLNAEALKHVNKELETLTEAENNAKKALSDFDGSAIFEKFAQSIKKTDTQLKQMSSGTKGSQVLEMFRQMENTYTAARAANDKLREDNSFFNKETQTWDTSTNEGLYAQQAYEENSRRIQAMRSGFVNNYNDIYARNVLEQQDFLEQYARGRQTSQRDQISQFYNGKIRSGTDRIRQLQAYIDEANAENAETSQKALRRHDVKAERNRNIQVWQNAIDQIRQQQDIFAQQRDIELQYNADSMPQRLELQRRQLEAQGEFSRVEYERQQRRYNNRFQQSAFSRNLESIISHREDTQKQISNIENQIKQKQLELNAAQALPEGTEDKQLRIEAADGQLKNLSADLERARAELDKYPASADNFNAAMDTINSSISRFITNFGARLFRQGIQEAKRFTVQFSAAMAEIQEITLMSGEQIDALGDNLVDTALKMKASISDVTSTATALFRQGLSQSQVESRMEDIIKFSTVSGVKADVATKLAAVAMNGDMVDSVNEIFDVVAMISDSAATNPEAITKAYQRSAYTAKSVGVTNDELTAMSAIITSLTQLSGNVAGTTLSNVFSRMRKISSSKLGFDKEGNLISQDDVAQALKLAGIDLMPGGKMTSATKILSELGTWWNSSDASDAKRNRIATALSGSGRQSSNFLAIMEGFSEIDENGETQFDRFMRLADSADGIVDKKYDVYMKTLAGAMTNLRNSFGALVKSVTDDMPIVSFFNTLSDGIQVIASLNDALGGLPVALAAIAAGLAVIDTVLKMGVIGQVITGIGGVVMAAGLLKGVIDNFKGPTNYETQKQNLQDASEAQKTAYELTKKVSTGSSLSKDEIESLSTAMSTLSKLGYVSDEAIKGIENMGTNAEKVADELLNAADRIKEDNENNEYKKAGEPLSEEQMRKDYEDFQVLADEPDVRDLATKALRRWYYKIYASPNDKNILFPDLIPETMTDEEYAEGEEASERLFDIFSTSNMREAGIIGMDPQQMYKDIFVDNADYWAARTALASRQQGFAESKRGDFLDLIKTARISFYDDKEYDQTKAEEAYADYLIGILSKLPFGQMLDMTNRFRENKALLTSVGRSWAAANSNNGLPYTEAELLGRAQGVYDQKIMEGQQGIPYDLYRKFESDMYGVYSADKFQSIIAEYENEGLNEALSSDNAIAASIKDLTENFSVEGSNKLRAQLRRKALEKEMLNSTDQARKNAESLLADTSTERSQAANALWTNLYDSQGLYSYASIIMSENAENLQDAQLEIIANALKIDVPKLRDELANESHRPMLAAQLSNYASQNVDDVTSALFNAISPNLSASPLDTDTLAALFPEYAMLIRNGEFTWDGTKLISNSSYDALGASITAKYRATKKTPFNDLYNYMKYASLDDLMANNPAMKSMIESDPYMNKLLGKYYDDEGFFTGNVSAVDKALFGRYVARNRENTLGLFDFQQEMEKRSEAIDILANLRKGNYDLDAIYSGNPVQQEHDLQLLIDQLGTEATSLILNGLMSEDNYDFILSTLETGVKVSSTSKKELAKMARSVSNMSSEQYENWFNSTTEEYRNAVLSVSEDLDTYNRLKDNEEMRRLFMPDEQFKQLETRVRLSTGAAIVEGTDAARYFEEYTGLTSSIVEDQWAAYAKVLKDKDNMTELNKYSNEVLSASGYDDLSKEAIQYILSNVEGMTAGRLESFMSTQQGRETISTQMQSKINSVQQGFGALIASLVPDLDKGTYSADYVSSKLSAAGYEALADLVDMIGIAITDGVANIDLGEENLSFSGILSDFRKQVVDSNDRKYYQQLINMANAGQTVEQYKGSISDSEYKKLVGYLGNNQDMMSWYNMYESGTISADAYSNFLNRRMSGKYSPIFDTQNLMEMFLGTGNPYEIENMDVGAIRDRYLQLQNSQDSADIALFNAINNSGAFDELIRAFTNYDNKLLTTTEATKNAEAALKNITNTAKNDLSQALMGSDPSFNRMKNNLEALRKGGSEAGKAMQDFKKEGIALNNANWAYDQYFNKGVRNKDVTGILAQYSSFDTETLRKATGKEALTIQRDVDLVLKPKTSEWLADAETDVNTMVNDGLQTIAASTTPELLLDCFVNGQFSLDGFLSALAKVDPAIAAAIKNGIQKYYDANIELNIGLNTNFIAATSGGTDLSAITSYFSDPKNGFATSTKASTGSGFGSKRIGSGSSGGGSKGKTEGEKLIERLKHGQSLYEHQIKMAQYEETRYQNLDELTNYARVLEEEIKLEKAYLPVLQDNIKALKAQMSSVSEGSEEWYKLRDAVLSAEEKYSEITNTIDENNKKLRENQQAIRKLHTNLEDMVVAEIKARIQRQRDMLAGNVNMQNTILDSIKNRYQKEWDLIKQDIDRKKKALEEEKSLIDERLQRRRSAEDQALQYEQLAELKRQYASISMDSSRTKDAANLRKQIQDMERSLGWDMAEAEATALSDAIQDQIDAYDEFASTGDEDLDKLLEDANNFGEEVKRILGMSHDDLMIWLQSNDESYRNSLNEAQQQILNDWDDTWKQMYGIVDTWWPQVQEILSSESSFIDFMSQSVDYLNASFDDQASSIYEWTEAYQQWMKALIDTANWMHEDFGVGSWSGKEYTGESNSSGSSGTGGRVGGSSIIGGNTQTPASNTIKNLTQKQQQILQNAGLAPEDIAKIDASTSISGSYNVYDSYGRSYGSFNTQAEAEAKAQSLRNMGVIAVWNKKDTATLGKVVNDASVQKSLESIINGNRYSYGATSNDLINGAALSSTVKKQLQAIADSNARLKQSDKEFANKLRGTALMPFSTGGEADFTGPIKVHGTPQLPERILSAEQTEAFNKLTDVAVKFDRQGVLDYMNSWSTFSSISPYMTQVASDDTYNNTVNVGDINIALYEAKLEDDADYDTIATKVGQKFAKELSKQGVRVAFNL